MALPQKISQPPSMGQPNIHIWSAGCSAGEEPYTIAMMLNDCFDGTKPRWDLGIFASDLSTRMLQQATDGLFPAEQLLHLPDTLRHRYFSQHSSRMWKVQSNIRDMVHFSRYNLIQPEFTFKGQFSVIFCRNVMIYFDMFTVEELIQRFYSVTENMGYLIIGQTETLNQASCPYEYVSPSIYRKVE